MAIGTINEIKSGCGNCWFCCNGQCLYASKCNGKGKWSNTLYAFVPVTYIENETLKWKE